MTDYPTALAALREARTKFNAEVARVAGPQTLQHRAEELSARVLDILDAIDAQVPSGFAYRYRDALAGGTVIRFNSGHEVNGSRPIEAVPYWLGAPPAPVAPAAAVPAGYVPVSALIEAREEVESWAAYATPYFQDKHDLAEVLAKIDGQIAAAQAQQPAAAVPPERDWTMIQSGDASIPAWVVHYANAIGAYMKGQNVQHWAVGPVQSRNEAQQPAAAVPEVDWRELYRIQTAMRYMDNNPGLTRDHAFSWADQEVAAMLAAANKENNNGNS